MTNAELIKVLRCELYGDDECDKSDCPIWSELGCRNGIANRAAADALEAADEKIADYTAAIDALDDSNDAYIKENERLKQRITELERQHGNQLTRNVMLTARIPKEGEWIWDDKRCIYVCSVCGSPKVRENMDRQIIKEQAYCYSCGAKMKGANDEKRD